MDYKKLWLNLLQYFTNTTKTNRGKNQIVDKMTKAELEEARESDEDLDNDIPY